MTLRLCKNCRILNKDLIGRNVYIPLSKKVEKAERDKQIRALRKKGVAVPDIASQFNLSVSHVQLICRTEVSR